MPDVNPAMERLRRILEKENIQHRFVLSSTEPLSNTTSVKTLIWEARPTLKGEGQNEPCYFVTALNATSRVKQAHLKKLFVDEMEIYLADTATAERLTGCVKGTIPPFGHVFPMMNLYIDSVLMNSEVHSLSVGSGSLGCDLVLSKTDMLQLCEKTTRVKECQLTTDGPSNAEIPLKRMKENGNLQSTAIENEQESIASRPRKALSKRLRDAAGKLGKSQEVRELIEEAGDRFAAIMGIGADGNNTKNAMHLAAWKGDLESIRVLAEAGKSFGFDLVNMISTGEGNYGKTPIFYSLTQCRDDAVQLLLELGANLLIVNNKGQSPCSMAQSHLKAETCDLLFTVEAKQLADGTGAFVNYRHSNSDGKRYGDLDPRFEIDSDNMGPDIQDEIQRYREALGLINGDEPREIPTGFGFPRVLRQTTRELRECSWKEKKVMSSSKLGRPTYDHTLRTSGKSNVDSDRKKKESSHTQDEAIDVTKFDCLRLGDVLKGQPIIVEDDMGVEEFADRVDSSVRSSVNSSSDLSYPADTAIASSCWGLDCEWKPSFKTGSDNPVATLQLSSTDKAFLVDLQQLCQPSVKGASQGMTKTEENLSRALSKLFSNKNIAISGFGIAQDLSKLSMSFPHMPCFRLFEAVIDIQQISRNAFAGTRKNYISSLQKAVAITMSKRLDKTEQCSNWEQRPLSTNQIEYAILDAVVSRMLVSTLVKKISDTGASEDHFFKSHSHLRQTLRIQYLDSEQQRSTTPMAYRVPMGTVKRMLGIRFAKQTWPTGKQPPPLPEEIPLSETQPQRVRNVKNGKAQKDSTQTISRPSRRNMGVALNTLPADKDGLPPAGVDLGWTKDSCVNRILGSQVLNSMPRDFKIRFNRWGGVIEMSNAWLLFINFKGNSNDWKYRNEVSDDGRRISFSVNPNRPTELALLEYIEKFHGLEADENVVLLFARPSSRSKFLFCGECKCIESCMGGDDINLVLELKDYDTLIAKEGGPYSQLLETGNHRSNYPET